MRPICQWRNCQQTSAAVLPWWLARHVRWRCCHYSRLDPRRQFSRKAWLAFRQAPRLREKAATFGNSASQSQLSGLPPFTRTPEQITELGYPRYQPHSKSSSCERFSERYKELSPDTSILDEVVEIRGRVKAIRSAGTKLIFLDILEDEHSLQIVCKLGQSDGSDFTKTGLTEDELLEVSDSIRRGDIVSVVGNPHRTRRGELSVLARNTPTVLSPCLHQFPTPEEQRFRPTIIHDHKHVDLLCSSRSRHILRYRSSIIQSIRQFLLDRSFIELDTPTLAAVAGGAVARPFETTSSEFPERKLSLRIAPELWLKRLVVGGFDKVFEIGSAFRNEGLDATHNPEYTTSEFYQAYTDLAGLMGLTESLFGKIKNNLTQQMRDVLPPPSFSTTLPFARLDFLPALQRELSHSLPKLDEEEALPALIEIFKKKSLYLPTNPTLPRLLDELATVYLEPQCTRPTFIINPPRCLSPLAKSFEHTETGHIVAARAELFIENKEIANMYEEENSPFEQRRKFQEQLSFKAEGANSAIDEDYLEALEWGLPPTGGWGAGIDRLVMLFTGATRIRDVLTFGDLRAVSRVKQGVDENRSARRNDEQ